MRSWKAFVHSGNLVLRYWFDQLRVYHRGTRLLLGNALAAQLFYAVLQRRIPYWLNSPGLQLHRDGSGRILGVAVENAGERVHLLARKGAVVATGGFPRSSALPEGFYYRPGRNDSGGGKVALVRCKLG